MGNKHYFVGIKRTIATLYLTKLICWGTSETGRTVVYGMPLSLHEEFFILRS